MNIRFLPMALLIRPLLLILLVGGCVRPDYPAVFETDLLYQDDNEQSEPVVVGSTPFAPVVAAKGGGITASGNLDLTVEESIQLALRHNRNLQIEQLNPLIATTFADIERGYYEPEMFGELEVVEEKNSAAGSSGSRTTVEENNRSAAVGLRQKLASGTKIEASVAQESTETDSNYREEQARVGVSVTQSLLRGFGSRVNLVNVRQAELGVEISRFELRGFTEALLAATENAYWEYVLAGRKIDIFARSHAIARQQLDEIEQRIEVGILPRIEAAAAQAEMARREQALIDVRSALEERRLRLLRLTSPGGNSQFDLQIRATSTAELNPDPILDQDDRLQLAAKSRPDLNEARLRLKQNRLETVMTRNGLLPRLDLFISLGKSGYADSFSDSFKNLEGNHYDVSGGIKISQYLFNRQGKGRDLAARASHRQTVEALANLEELVELDVRLAVNEFERSRRQIAATRATRLLQEETLAAEKERFDVGASTALLVAQAQRDLLAGSIGEVEAIINCRQALVKLYLAEGSLLERRGVRLAGSPWARD